MDAEIPEHAAERKGSLAKSQLVEAVAEDIGLGRDEAYAIVEVILGGIARALHRGERVEIRGFGTFSSHERQPRNGRNPKNGARVPVPAKRVAAFKASKTLLRSLNRTRDV